MPFRTINLDGDVDRRAPQVGHIASAAVIDTCVSNRHIRNNPRMAEVRHAVWRCPFDHVFQPICKKVSEQDLKGKIYNA